LIKGIFTKKSNSYHKLVKNQMLDLKAENISEISISISYMSFISLNRMIDNYSFFIKTWRNTLQFEKIDEKTMNKFEDLLKQFKKSYERSNELLIKMRESSDKDIELLEGRFNEQSDVLINSKNKIEKIVSSHVLEVFTVI